jgi:hypothetical protein
MTIELEHHVDRPVGAAQRDDPPLASAWNQPESPRKHARIWQTTVS